MNPPSIRGAFRRVAAITAAAGVTALLSLTNTSAASATPVTFTYYAGPVTLAAANQCVTWGGSHDGTSWTSGRSHCG